jgi:hypothetical protein
VRQSFCFSESDSGISKLIVSLLIIAFIAAFLVIGYYATTNQSTQNPSPTPTFSSEPTASPTLTISPIPSASPIPHATITVKIIDNETMKFVDNASVLVDRKEVGTTMQNGELDIENLEYGKHSISIFPYHGLNIVEQDINVSGDMILPFSVNMPNPVFEATVSVKRDYVAFRELGRVSITLTNTGQIDSQNTISLVFIYNEDNSDTAITTRIIDFGNITADQQPITKEIAGIDSFVWPNVEYVVVVIIDQWKYTPENNQIINENNIPAWFPAQALNDIYNYIEHHPEINGSIAKIILTK